MQAMLANPMMLMTTRGVRISTIEDLEKLATHCCRSGMFVDVKEASAAVIKIQYGAELGLSPIASLSGIHLVKGKLTISAGAIAARIDSSGTHSYRIVVHTATECEIELKRGTEVLGQSSFSIDDAKKAGIIDNAQWRAYPRNMLFARAISNAQKWYAPGLFEVSVYSTEEMVDVVEMRDEPAEDKAASNPPRDAGLDRMTQSQREAITAALGALHVERADRREYLLRECDMVPTTSADAMLVLERLAAVMSPLRDGEKGDGNE